jgi:hypothetical protein
MDSPSKTSEPPTMSVWLDRTFEVIERVDTLRRDRKADRRRRRQARLRLLYLGHAALFVTAVVVGAVWWLSGQEAAGWVAWTYAGWFIVLAGHSWVTWALPTMSTEADSRR